MKFFVVEYTQTTPGPKGDRTDTLYRLFDMQSQPDAQKFIDEIKSFGESFNLRIRDIDEALLA